ncbi:hypothetical protein PMI07_002070 [Rhizobium sp. CF080]|uniref:hypothetical protein n=1 Tax=Rhizobium sp. (strain CF080) TaxID=1144310 RepID=UPI000271A3BD|nr:hypothetical protein [Rhizobium sp. CF080]EUB95582.1 hypothetical protein PMI07_002070 [Rhizobium sp. CF080]
MKITKSFEAKAVDGQITVTSKPLIPTRIAIVSAVLELNDETPQDAEKTFTVSVNGEVASTGTGTPGRKFSFKPPIKLAFGRPTITFVSGPFAAGESVKGQVTLKIKVL